jgi:hypothetical protein
VTRGQREFLDVLQLMIRTKPGFRQIKPDPIMDPPFKVLAYKIVTYDRATGTDRGTTFELFSSVLVALNTITLALYSFTGPEEGEFLKVKRGGHMALDQEKERGGVLCREGARKAGEKGAVTADHASEPWKSLGMYMENSMVPLRQGGVQARCP